MKDVDIVKKANKIREGVYKDAPLVHCITNHITIDDCANMVLCVGARPIMAEHIREVEDITCVSKALCVNLGNITDARMESMMLSGKVALRDNIGSIIDIVGVGCSRLRLDYAKKYIEECKPSIVKGNMSEIKALYGVSSHAEGIDAGAEDDINEQTLTEAINIARKLANIYKTVVVITGREDIVSTESVTYVIKNGTKMLRDVTGTGCMLNVIIGSMITQKDYVTGAVAALLLMNIAGEIASSNSGIGSFKMALFDVIYTMNDEVLIERGKVDRYE